ncbi:MAG TPA: 4'-phosphopantetheinyl transferase superfamily protein [Kofleriaceae bacterium]|nr:4'-phosphopantetheinyl transferase superfamily protein [Kofleriaceae bacterium]
MPAGDETAVVEIRVRVLALAGEAARREELLAAITPDEAARRLRFRREEDRARFLLGRATLRQEVGRALGLPPRDVPLAASESGKPVVAGGALEVNVSHAGDVVLVALARGAAIGVDVEQLDPRYAGDPGVPLSRRELGDLAALPPDLRLRGFFHAWTAKEAIVKAVGTGLGLPLDSFDVSVDPRRPPALLAARHPALAAPLSLAPIAVPAGHVAAAAAVAPACAVRYSRP